MIINDLLSSYMLKLKVVWGEYLKEICFMSEEMARRFTLNSVSKSMLLEIPVFVTVRNMPRHVLALLTCV